MWERFGAAFRSSAARLLARARAAELRGELPQAAILFAKAGRPDEAARVMVLRGDTETDAAERLKHYVQAVATAPEGSPAHAHARRKRAAFVLSAAAGAPVTAAARHDLRDAGRELEALGEPELAAEAFARAGDVEGEARALARAGDVEKLDALLREQQGRDREAHAQRALHDQVALLLAAGRRKEAAALGQTAHDEVVRQRAAALEARRVASDVVTVSVRGARSALVLGDEVVIGRTAAISIASAAVSRHHVAVTRRGAGACVRDLGSRNGTTLRGLALAGELPVGDGVEVRLGDQVPLKVTPAAGPQGGWAIEIAGARFTAPLGPAMLGVGRWRLERGGDGWVALVTDDDPPAFAGGNSMAPRIELLAGDAFATARDGEPLVVVHGAGAEPDERRDAR
jgi:hypothetical protein